MNADPILEDIKTSIRPIKKVRPWLCQFLFHKWGAWIRERDPAFEVLVYFQYRRTCLRCGRENIVDEFAWRKRT